MSLDICRHSIKAHFLSVLFLQDKIVECEYSLCSLHQLDFYCKYLLCPLEVMMQTGQCQFDTTVLCAVFLCPKATVVEKLMLSSQVKMLPVK